MIADRDCNRGSTHAEGTESSTKKEMALAAQETMVWAERSANEVEEHSQVRE